MNPQHRPAPATAALSLLSVLAALLTLALPSLAQDNPASPAEPPGPIYVDKDATGLADGSSWENACLTIHDALARIVSGEVWVAAGVYYPDEGWGQIADDPEEAFRLEQGVEFYGGFDPSVGDVEWVDRDPDNNVTVLSGDIDQNDTTGIEGRNSYHVVTAEDVMKSAVMDGFTITAGSADSDTDEVHCQGGGIRSEDAAPTLNNLRIQGNRASCQVLESPAGYGGGIYNTGGSPYFSNVTFQENYAGLSGGGLYYTTEAGDLGGSVTGLTFIDNEAGTSGGGMSLVTSLGHSLSNLTFEDNSAGESGGGLYVQSDALSTMGSSWFESNAAPDGGGIYVDQSRFNLSSTTLLANDASDQGGGIFSQQSQYSLSNVTVNTNHADTAGGGIFSTGNAASIGASQFTGNTSVQGGGMYVDDQDLEDAALTIQNGTLFAGNVASEDGGGIYVINSPEGTLIDAYFVNNEATSGSGGGLFLSESGPYHLSSIGFSFNRAAYGGGLCVEDAEPTLSGVAFETNQATAGGGIYLFPNGDADISDARFTENSAVAGGGMYINDSNPTLTNVAFRGNEADGSSGGGLWNDAGVPTLRDVLFSGNKATLHGGGMRNVSSGSNVTLANATFSGNAAGGSGGGLYTTSSNVAIYNSVIWQNQDSSGTGTEDASIAGAVDVIEHSLIQNYALSGTNLDGTNTDNDPQFVVPVDPASAPTVEGVLSVKFESPIVDAGGSYTVMAGVTSDLAGNPRIYNGTIDLGVYELQLACPPIETTRLYVDRTESLGNGGLSWADALPNLRDALTLIAECDGNVIAEVWVAKGVYRPDEGVGMVPDSRDETYELIYGLAVYGGFAGTESTLIERDWVTNLTVLSGDVDSNDIATGGVVNVPGNIYGANSYHVVIASGVGDTSILDGFTITAGQANGDALDPEGHGAGIYNDAGSPTLANLTFIGNLAANGGGLANLNDSNPPLADSRFENNMATLSGGGIYNQASSPTLSNLVFTGNYGDNGGGLTNLSGSNPPLTTVQFSSNTAGTSGGGIYNKTSNPALTNVQFRSNTAGTSGGGIYNELSSPTLTDALLSGNSAPTGAAIYNDASAPTLINALLSGNFAYARGAAVYNTGSGPALVNVTVAGNRAVTAAGGMFNTADSHPSLRNSIFWDNRDATGTGTASATIYNDDPESEPTIEYSLVQSLDSITYTGDNNLDRNPWFTAPLDPALAPSTAGDFTLWMFSPAIDAGNNDFNPTGFDLAGGVRVINDIIDLGPYEAPFVQLYDVFLPVVLRVSP